MLPFLPLLFAILSIAQVMVAARTEITHGDLEEREINAWPLFVATRHTTTSASPGWTAAGPFLFSQPGAAGTVSGFRPFLVQTADSTGGMVSVLSLYPLFNYTQDAATYRWSLFELVRRQGRRDGAPAPEGAFDRRREFEVFPFWFERDFDDPALDYRALFPLHGTIRHKLGIERFSWTLFPLFAESERRGAVTTYLPWPFLRVTRGAAEGWGLWPLFTSVRRPGVSSETHLLWPLLHDRVILPAPDDPPETQPRRDAAFLPFYSMSSGPGFQSETWLWPFFGYTERTQPVLYSERRYLWPLFVQGRGEGIRVNRWAPFYTHSEKNGLDKRWLLWPLVRHARWTEDGIERERGQLLYFLYWQERQRAAGRADSPTASLTHFWPLLSAWDNGAGHRQWQFPSLLEVFFPGNTKVRQTWSPFLALVRHEELPSGEGRTSLLWNAITWHDQPSQERHEFHLGPLLGISRAGLERRIALGGGLLGLHRAASGRWRILWWDFPRENPDHQPRNF